MYIYIYIENAELLKKDTFSMPKECEKKMPKSLHRKDAGNVRTDPEEKQLLDHHYIASHACLGKSEGQVVRQKSPVRLNVGWKHVIGMK